MQDEGEAAYWDRHDALTKQWAELLESDDGVQYAMAPAAVSHSLLKRPDSAMTSKLSQRADDEVRVFFSLLPPCVFCFGC